MTDPAAIEDELAALWAEIGREQPVARAMMSNLVVVKERRPKEPLDLTAPAADLPLDEVARRHPARILLIHHVAGAPANCPPIAAAVSVLTFGAAAPRYGVETIAVESFCPTTSLPSIVRRLTFGDLPTTLWWAEDLSRIAPIEPLAAMCRQVLYDSRDWRDLKAGVAAAARLLTMAAPPDLADLNWRRLAPLRTALPSLVRARDDALEPGLHVRVEHRPGEGALAQLAAGWIAARLRWKPGAWPIEIEERRHGDDVLRLTLADARGRTITADQNGRRLRVRDSVSASPIVLPVPHHSAADAVAMELAALGQDVCLRDALLTLAQRT